MIASAQLESWRIVRGTSSSYGAKGERGRGQGRCRGWAAWAGVRRGGRRREHPGGAGLAAPRPQLLVNGRHDGNHPLQAAAEAWPRTRAIYAAAGASEAVRWFVGEGGHRYYAAPVWPWLAGALALPPAFATARYAAAPPAPPAPPTSPTRSASALAPATVAATGPRPS
jgi:hypothetical protein